jgi:Cu/Ag efflux protein CusF
MSGLTPISDVDRSAANGCIRSMPFRNDMLASVTFNHGPIPEIKWPAMKMEFPVVPSVDLSKVKVGDKVRFTLSGSGNSYTVQQISPAP